MTAATAIAAGPVRCAIYTRKSTDEGLGQDFNSLDNQRERAEAYIAEPGGLARPARPLRRRRLLRRQHRPARAEAAPRRRRGRARSRWWSSTASTGSRRSLADFVQIHELPREARRRHRLGHRVDQLADAPRPDDGQRAAQLRAVRAGAGRRAHPAQDRGRPPPREVDRRPPRPGLRHRTRGREARRQQGRGPAGPGDLRAVRREPVAGRHRPGAEPARLAAEAVDDQARHARQAAAPGTSHRCGRCSQNPLYIGLQKLGDETFKGEHKAIVTKKLFDRVQRLMDGNRRDGGAAARNSHGFLLRGLIRARPATRR